MVALEDYYGLAYRVTRGVLDRSMAAGHEVYVSYDPIHAHKIDGLYYPNSGLCILVGDAENATRTLPLRRLAHAETLREIRGEVRAAVALRERLTEAALRQLAASAKYHFELESIYSKAMNFEAKESFTESFCAELFR